MTAPALRCLSGRSPSSATERRRYVFIVEKNVLSTFIFLNLRFLIGLALALSAQAVVAEDGDFPKWLAGKPDLDRKADRCAVYGWFFKEADKQTEGTASKDELAAMRLINLANKLVDHHLSDPSDSYGVELDFLVIGRERGPFDFEFEISSTELERTMNKGCGE